MVFVHRDNSNIYHEANGSPTSGKARREPAISYGYISYNPD